MSELIELGFKKTENCFKPYWKQIEKNVKNTHLNVEDVFEKKRMKTYITKI